LKSKLAKKTLFSQQIHQLCKQEEPEFQRLFFICKVSKNKVVLTVRERLMDSLIKFDERGKTWFNFK